MTPSSFLVALALAAGPEMRAITGTASCRERILLPPDAVFEATLEDVTRADAPATVIARQRLAPVGEMPYAVDIPYDPAQIQPKARYVVRATLQSGKRRWATTAIVPVLTHGGGAKVELVLKRLSAAAAAAAGSTPGTAAAPPPGTFEGVLPCADCPGIKNQLSLFDDHAFHLRVQHLGRPDDVHDAIGSWALSSDGRILALAGAGDAPTYFAFKDADHLTKLDERGLPITSPASLDLVRGVSPSPFEPRLTLMGLLTYKAATASFQECLTGRRLPVVEDGDYPALESAYRQERRKPELSVFTVVEGRIVQRAVARRPASPMLYVEKLVELRPGDSCAPRLEAAPLERTYWKLTQLDGAAVPPNERQPRREAHLVFGSDQGRLVGSDGCNGIVAEYVIDGARMKLGPLAGTSMECTEVDDLDQRFRQALAKTAAWRTLGRTLELLDAEDGRLALFDAATPPAPARPAAPRR